jgi:hypothetical protein
LPGENADLLLDLQQEWYAACDPTDPAHKARVDAAITSDWLFRRADRLYYSLRAPENREMDTPALTALMRRRGELRRLVRIYKNVLGYSVRRAKLYHAVARGADFDDIHWNAT